MAQLGSRLHVGEQRFDRVAVVWKADVTGSSWKQRAGNGSEGQAAFELVARRPAIGARAQRCVHVVQAWRRRQTRFDRVWLRGSNATAGRDRGPMYVGMTRARLPAEAR